MAGPDASIELALPVACAIGSACVVQQYFDHDPGPGARDYRCGVMSYDGHDGVDIRLPTLAAQRQGVAVIAAAPGVVKGVRDGMIDQDIRVLGNASVRNRECGNGVIVAHTGGWQTQYCHMAKGSVRVRVGDAVGVGTHLGLIGESGAAAFPHLHFAVLRDGTKVDPFAWDAPGGRCGAGHALWSASAAQALVYRAPDLLNAGFTDAPVTIDDVESGRAAASPPDARSPMLSAYARIIGLKAGDIVALTLSAPDTAVLATSSTKPLDHDKAQYFSFVGVRRHAAPWAPGRYAGVVEVRRAGAVVLSRRFELQL